MILRKKINLEEIETSSFGFSLSVLEENLLDYYSGVSVLSFELRREQDGWM